MSSKLLNMGWYYRGRAENEMGTPESLNYQILYALLVTFTITGFLSILFWSVRFVRLFLSLFILPGRRVSVE